MYHDPVLPHGHQVTISSLVQCVSALGSGVERLVLGYRDKMRFSRGGCYKVEVECYIDTLDTYLHKEIIK